MREQLQIGRSHAADVCLAVEVTYNADQAVRAMLAPAYTRIEMRTDPAGSPRVAAARFPG
jgi:hypothetical protein